jgi:hypothetical protein
MKEGRKEGRKMGIVIVRRGSRIGRREGVVDPDIVPI